MTTPVAADRPDFGGQSALSSVIVDQRTAVLITANTTLGPFPVSLSPYLGLSILVTGACFIDFDFWSDQAATQFLTRMTFETNGTGKIRQCIPVAGPWMTVTIGPLPANFSYTGRIWFSPTAFFSSEDSSVDNILLNQYGTNIPAATEIIYTIAQVYAGPAYIITFLENGISYRCTLEAINAAGTLTLIDHTTHAQMVTPRLIFLPSRSIQLRVHNFEGATARQLFAVLSTKPFTQ